MANDGNLNRIEITDYLRDKRPQITLLLIKDILERMYTEYCETVSIRGEKESFEDLEAQIRQKARVESILAVGVQDAYISRFLEEKQAEHALNVKAHAQTHSADIVFQSFEKRVETLVAETLKKKGHKELQKADVIPSLYSLLEKIERPKNARKLSGSDIRFAARYREHVNYVVQNLKEYTNWLRPLYDLPSSDVIPKERKSAFLYSVLDLINAPTAERLNVREQPNAETAASYVENVFKEQLEKYTALKLRANTPLVEIGKGLTWLAREVAKFDPTLAAPYTRYVDAVLADMSAYEVQVRNLYSIPVPASKPVASFGYDAWFAVGEEQNNTDQTAAARNAEVLALRTVIREANKPESRLEGIIRTVGHVMKASAVTAVLVIATFFGYTQLIREEIYAPQKETVAVVQSQAVEMNPTQNQVSAITESVVYQNTPALKKTYVPSAPVEIKDIPRHGRPGVSYKSVVKEPDAQVNIPISVVYYTPKLGNGLDSLSLVAPQKVQVIDRRLRQCDHAPLKQQGSAQFHYHTYCQSL